jgi:hypothetical protein
MVNKIGEKEPFTFPYPVHIPPHRIRGHKIFVPEGLFIEWHGAHKGLFLIIISLTF